MMWAAKQLQVMSHQVTEVELRGQGDGRTPTGIHLPMPAQNQTDAHNTSPRATHSRSAAVTQPVAQPDSVASFTGIAGLGAAHMFRLLQVDTFTARRSSLHWISWVSQRRTPEPRKPAKEDIDFQVGGGQGG